MAGTREGASARPGARASRCRRPLYVARKERRQDEWDPPIAPYGPYGPGVSQRAASDFDVITDDEGDTSPTKSDTSLS